MFLADMSQSLGKFGPLDHPRIASEGGANELDVRTPHKEDVSYPAYCLPKNGRILEGSVQHNHPSNRRERQEEQNEKLLESAVRNLIQCSHRFTGQPFSSQHRPQSCYLKYTDVSASQFRLIGRGLSFESQKARG